MQRTFAGGSALLLMLPWSAFAQDAAHPKTETGITTRPLYAKGWEYLSPDGKTAVDINDIPDGGGHMTVYDTVTGTARYHIDIKAYFGPVVFMPDSRSFVTDWGRPRVRFWSVTTEKDVRDLSLPGIDYYSTPRLISPNGKILVTGSSLGAIQFWDLSTGRALRTLQRHTAAPESEAFSTDGKTLAIGSEDGTARLWSFPDGQLLRTLQKQAGTLSAIALSHDGNTLATGSTEKQIKLWDVRTGREIHTLQGHTTDVLSLAFSHDDRWLASGDRYETARLWNVHSGHQERVFRADRGGAMISVAFLKGDSRLMIADGKTLAFYPLPSSP